MLGRGAPLRNDITDGEVKKFKSDYVCTKKKASSQGGVHPPPLDPPLMLLCDKFQIASLADFNMKANLVIEW